MTLLPEDIIGFDILPWLPAKAIYKFKCVSKSFSKVSEDPNFITKQVQNSSTKDDTCLFIQPNTFKYGARRVVELHPLPRNQSSSGIPSDFLNSISNSATVLSSSNGLILFSTYPTILFICNPVTKSWSLIPNPIKHRDSYVHDDLIILLECYKGVDDYSLFHFERERGISMPGYRCNVYNAKEGVWKTTEGRFMMRGGMKFECMPVFLNGIFYIISAHYPYYLLTYNLENGVTTMFRLLPEQVDKESFVGCLRIFKWGKASSSTQSICLVKFDKSVFTIWFLRGCKSFSWKKLLEMGVETMGVNEKDAKVTSYMVINGDLLIFATEKKVYSYGLGGERYMMIEEICEHNCRSKPCFVPYKDTLRRC